MTISFKRIATLVLLSCLMAEAPLAPLAAGQIPASTSKSCFSRFDREAMSLRAAAIPERQVRAYRPFIALFAMLAAGLAMGQEPARPQAEEISIQQLIDRHDIQGLETVLSTNKDWIVRWEAVGALKDLRDSATIPILLKAAADSDRDVAKVAVEGLLAFASPEVAAASLVKFWPAVYKRDNPFLDEDYDALFNWMASQRDGGVSVLTSAAGPNPGQDVHLLLAIAGAFNGPREQTAGRLVPLLETEGEIAQDLTREFLYRYFEAKDANGSPLSPHVITGENLRRLVYLALHSSEFSGWELESVLIKLHSPEAKPLLLAALTDKDENVREHASHILMHLKESDSAEALLQMVKSYRGLFDSIDSINVMHLVAKLGPRVIDLLLAAAQDPANSEYRLKAAMALFDSVPPEPRVIERLKAILKEPDIGSRLRIIDGFLYERGPMFDALKEPIREAIQKLVNDVTRAADPGLSEFLYMILFDHLHPPTELMTGNEFARLLPNLLKSDLDFVKLEGFVQRAGAAALLPLERMAKTPDTYDLNEVDHLLATLGDAGVTALIRASAESSDPKNRLAAIYALGPVKPNQAIIDALFARVSDANTDVKNAALYELQWLWRSHVPLPAAIEDMVSAADRAERRQRALDMLSRSKTDAAAILSSTKYYGADWVTPADVPLFNNMLEQEIRQKGDGAIYQWAQAFGRFLPGVADLSGIFYSNDVRKDNLDILRELLKKRNGSLAPFSASTYDFLIQSEAETAARTLTYLANNSQINSSAEEAALDKASAGILYRILADGNFESGSIAAVNLLDRLRAKMTAENVSWQDLRRSQGDMIFWLFINQINRLKRDDKDTTYSPLINELLRVYKEMKKAQALPYAPFDFLLRALLWDAHSIKLHDQAFKQVA